MLHTCIDMTHRQVELPIFPRRIVSLVPSQTELLYDLGLRNEVVGITKFCIHPDEWFRSKKRIGGTKTVHTDQVAALQPDLILANKEENTREQVEELAAQFPVWISDIKTVNEGLQMIREVGLITGHEEWGLAIANEISKGFEVLARQSTAQKRVAYFIWRKPWMCAGGDTFISNVLERMGWENALGDMTRYPEIDLEQLMGRNIDMVLLSSEPYPFKAPHIAEIKAALPGVKVMLVDGEMFSWYGSRMRLATSYLGNLLQV